MGIATVEEAAVIGWEPDSTTQAITFERRRKFIFAHRVHLRGILVRFVYEGHRVKVTGARNVENLYSRSVNFNRQ